MSSPYMSEIRMMGFNFPPKAWALCNGQLLPLQQNTALFSLLGTNFGGDGVRDFALPDLRGRVPIHMGQNFTGSRYSIGQKGGEVAHTLALTEVPQHTHTMSVKKGPADTGQGAPGVHPASNKAVAEAAATEGASGTKPVNIFGTGSASAAFSPSAIGSVGGSPHPNQQPYLVINFCIALSGVFPSRN